MLYDVGSDLHVDINATLGAPKFKELKNKGSDTIVLAGDLANDPEMAVNILAMAASVYETVIFVDGNHEFYNNWKTGMSVDTTMEYFKQVAQTIPNLVYLHGDNYHMIDDVMFVGANVWYDFKLSPPYVTSVAAKAAWYNGLNDARLIVFDKEPEVYAELQSDMIAQLVAEAQDDQRIEKIVVVTHSVSSPKGLTVKNNPSWDMLNGSFGCAAMSKVWKADTNKKIVHAVCGHTHFGFDFNDFDGIRFVINPRGYVGANEGAEHWFLVQLDTKEIRS